MIRSAQHRQYIPDPNADLFAMIRSGYESVAGAAQHVRIRTDLVPAYADSLPNHPPGNVMDKTHHYHGTPENTAAYVLVLDSINFGSGYERHLVGEGWERIDNSLYFGIATRVKALFEQAPLNAAELVLFTPEQAAQMLALDVDGAYSREFSSLCAKSLQELGQIVVQNYDGSFLNMVNAAQESAGTMVRILATLRHFNDVHEYNGQMVPFYKRAQITAADLHLAFGRTLFSDINLLTMFPDNGVPHVFHVDGLLEYSPALATRIKAGEDIPSGSEEEIEIRACAAHIVELIADRKGMIAMDVDHVLWHRSVEDPRYSETEPHRTLTEFY